MKNKLTAFISYSSKDEENAIEIRNLLVEKGFDCWMAPDSIPPGSDYAKEIPNGIEESGAFLLLLSINSQSSVWVPKELCYALEKRKIVIPFKMDNCEMTKQFSFLLSNVQMVNSCDSVDLLHILKRIDEMPYERSKSKTKPNTEEIQYYGPERKTYSWVNRAQYATFNSIIDNPEYGDERYFVKIREVIKGKSTDYDTNIIIRPGHKYEVSIFYHNNADPKTVAKEAVGIADGVAVRSSFPKKLNANEQGVVSAYINASDTDPIEIWAKAFVKSEKECYLRYIPGSATIHNNGELNGICPGADYLFGLGSMLGFNLFSGLMPGGYEYAGKITYQLFADFPDYEISIKATYIKSEYDNDIYSVKVSYENVGSMDQLNVVVQAHLETSVHYETGSSILNNNNNVDGKKVNDDIISEQGMNIGNYAGGSGWAWLTFKVSVSSIRNEKTKIGVLVSTADGNKSVYTYLEQ